jgi:hypothetical protein
MKKLLDHKQYKQVLDLFDKQSNSCTDVIINMAIKADVMKSIAARLGMDISTMDNQKIENFLVQAHANACITNDRDAIIGCDYLRKFNVRINSLLFFFKYVFM